MKHPSTTSQVTEHDSRKTKAEGVDGSDVSAGYARLGAGLMLELLSLDDLGFTLGGLSEAKSSAKEQENKSAIDSIRL